jgi:two-component system, OmpR family, response regulator CpxR
LLTFGVGTENRLYGGYSLVTMEKVLSERATILVIDDDVRLCQLIAQFFADSEYVIQAVHNGPSGLARSLESSFDLILLDVMLPGLDGFEVLTQLRRRSAIPVIMLTARGAREDCVRGLNAGADDYLSITFSQLSRRMSHLGVCD